MAGGWGLAGRGHVGMEVRGQPLPKVQGNPYIGRWPLCCWVEEKDQSIPEVTLMGTHPQASPATRLIGAALNRRGGLLLAAPGAHPSEHTEETMTS